jgi:AAA family ATP:ADP antiporter
VTSSPPTTEPPGPRQDDGVARAGRQRWVDIRPGEGALVAIAAIYSFLALASWYVLRPIRDDMGVAGGVENLAWLFTGTLVAMLATQPIYSALVARWPRGRFLPWVYRFFGFNLLLFFAALELGPSGAQVWIGRAFFVWTSVFNLFVISVFWSFMADVFRTDQGRRIYGLLAAGGTLGGIAGGAATAGLVEAFGSAPLLLLSAVLLEAAAACARRLGRRAGAASPEQARAEREAVGGGPLAGLAHVARSPYLLGLCLFLFLYTIGSTFLYFLQVDIVAGAFSDRGARTAFFARVDLWVNGITLLLQTGVTGRLLTRLGVGGTLALLPALSVVGFAAVGIAPSLTLLVAFQMARRAGNFAVARPARELLFVPLAREDKYKAKNFIDTVVYRVGDQAGAWTSSGIAAVGLGAGAVAAVAAPLAAVWLVLALWLGRRYTRLARAREDAAALAAA